MLFRSDQAELTIRTSTGTYMSHPEFNKKFAELIVGECLGTLNHRYQWDGDVHDPQEIKKCIHRIQKHFGVE